MTVGIIVGSFALGVVTDKMADHNNDIDVWVREGENTDALRNDTVVYDISVMPDHIMDILQKYSFQNTNCAGLNALYTIKLSHLEYDIKWRKHASHTMYLYRLGCEPIPELLEALVDHWKQLHGSSKSKLSLYKTKDEFFDDFVPKRFDHDYLHELVARPGRPVYETVLKEGQEVLVDHKKFLGLPYDQQVRMFKEEVAVIALERWLLNPKYKGTMIEAWNRSVHKTVTSLTKGWASRFIVDNLHEFRFPLSNEIHSTMEYLGMSYNELTFSELREKILAALIENGAGYKVWSSTDHEYKVIPYANISDLENVEIFQWQSGDTGLEGIVEIVHTEGGGEGGSECVTTVIKIKGDDNFYRVDYSYYSYEGYNFDYAEVRIVEPKKVQVTVYE